MKLIPGIPYVSRSGGLIGRVATKEKFREVFGYSPLIDDRPVLVIYDPNNEWNTHSYAHLHENGLSKINEENDWDLVRPLGNILNA